MINRIKNKFFMQCLALRDAKHHIIYKIKNFIYYSIFMTEQSEGIIYPEHITQIPSSSLQSAGFFFCLSFNSFSLLGSTVNF